ncbi:hypothetical protein ACLVWU_13890 [Bdellovibrio sp. HCB290]|uniref:hypothetical protein n=1 Tax=Bdellovibrio sp. HCB290 TaxID=3394356 RepID=UPI0039B4D353
MKFLCLFLSFLVIVPAAAHAEGNKVGNGGDGVFCKGTSAGQILDFYEGDLKLSSTENDPYKIVDEKFNDLKKAAPKLGEQYLNRLKTIRTDFDFKTNVSLKNIKDSNHLFKPADPTCEVTQVVIRRRSPLENEKQFLVRQDLWDRLPAIEQAGMISHEIIYEHLIKLGATDSVKARALNRYVFSEKYDSKKFWKFIENLEVSIYP